MTLRFVVSFLPSEKENQSCQVVEQECLVYELSECCKECFYVCFLVYSGAVQCSRDYGKPVGG